MYLTSEAGLDRDVTLARQYLRHSLEGMRSGKSEWGFGKDALAVAALQVCLLQSWLNTGMSIYNAVPAFFLRQL